MSSYNTEIDIRPKNKSVSILCAALTAGEIGRGMNGLITNSPPHHSAPMDEFPRPNKSPYHGSLSPSLLTPE